MTTSVDMDAVDTLPKLIRAAAHYFRESPAVILERDGLVLETVTFAQIDVRSRILARGLLARGVGKGSRVGFIYGNGPDFVVLLAAIARIGAIAIPISTMVRRDELVRILRHSDVGGLVIQRTLLGKDNVASLCEAFPELHHCTPDLRIGAAPFLRWVLSSGERLPAAIGDIACLAEEAETVSDDILREVEAEVCASDQAVEIYTSGSMAAPKGVKHLHGPIMHRNRYVARMTGRIQGQRVMCHMPMFWVGGMGLFLMSSLVSGATTVCTERTMADSRLAMGTVLAPDELERMASSRPFWSLGMSETFGPYAYGHELRAAGYPLCAPLDTVADEFEVRVSKKNGESGDDGEVGEIQVRGYALTPALHKLEKEAYFTPDGFYRTGDLGMVEGRRINFVGRSGDMIKSAGANVSPAEVELELLKIPKVHSAYVVGLPDSDRGQIVAAAVIATEGSVLDLDAMQEVLRSRLSSYKVPRVIIAIDRSAVPMLHSNKVSRRQLATLIEQKLGSQQSLP